MKVYSFGAENAPVILLLPGRFVRGSAIRSSGHSW